MIYEWFTDLASMSSIVGLIITILLLIEARKIRESFLLKARLPEIINDFEQISLNLIESTKDWEKSKAERLKELARCKSILTDIKIKLSKNVQNNIDDFVMKISNKELSDLNIDEVYNIYAELQVVVESLKQTKENLKWGE